ncbi:MAG: zinc ribbon domain-containing protein [Ruminococcaceae bacterium]|nr:zinc ribbon domain-containing protein [Oscillospiraceae bacterium]
MKRIFASLLIVLCLIGVCSPLALTADTRYEIPEVGISIWLPEEYAAQVRSGEPNNTYLSIVGFTYAECMDLMLESNMYLDAFSDDLCEVYIAMTDVGTADLRDYTSAELNTTLSTVKSSYDPLVSVRECYVREISGIPFFYIEYAKSSESLNVYTQHYITMLNGKRLDIGHSVINRQIGSADRNEMDSIINSFTLLSDTRKPSPAFVYTDEVSGVSFTVPENYKQKELEQNNGSIQFYRIDAPHVILQYMMTDLWADIPASERGDASREDIDKMHQFLTQSELEEFFDCPIWDFHTVRYNNNDYHVFSMAVTHVVGDTSIAVDITTAAAFKNGCSYVFQFPGTEGDEHYADFVSLLSSVKIPSIAHPIGSTSPGSIKESNSPLARFRQLLAEDIVLWIIVNLSLTILIHPLPLWLYRWCIRKKPVAPKRAKKIVIIDAVIVFVVMNVIAYFGSGRVTGAAIILWAWVSYRVLISGHKNAETPEVPAEEDEIEPDSEIEDISEDSDLTEIPVSAEEETAKEDPPVPAFCRKCGTKLIAGAGFCNKCGTAVIKE